MLIMISVPYRSGTGDDPVLIAKNLARLEAMALPIFEKGHVPVIGEWLALPLMKLAGSTQTGDAIYDKISYPTAHQLLRSCDAVLRIEGASKGADKDVEIAKSLGLEVYFDIADVPVESEVGSS
ncbi:MAG: DUF4406 domain-containing protein [Saprospiraceae bacterium]